MDLIKYVYKCEIHEVSCFEPYMTFIEEGKKTVEGRVGNSYYTKIKSGSVLRLYNREKEIWCEVTHTHSYSTFKAMLEKEGLKNMLPQAKSIEDGIRIYRSFPTFAEKEKQFGAYAIGVKFIDLEKLKQKAMLIKFNQ